MADTNEMREKEKCSSDLPLVIGIGASAGGLEALQQFFQNMPGNSGLCFVVIQHLSPDYKSLMADILGKHTEMNVLQAENGMEVKPDTVYLIPPKNNMTLKEGRLYLTEFIHGMLNHPIDAFFRFSGEGAEGEGYRGRHVGDRLRWNQRHQGGKGERRTCHCAEAGYRKI